MDEFVPLEAMSLRPVNFFAFELECYSLTDGKFEKRHILPDLSELSLEKGFAQVSLGWSRDGVSAVVEMPKQEELAVELFLDTRDIKSAGFNTRFCHHFLFDAKSGKEITHFRTEDKHELCNPLDLFVASEAGRTRLISKIFIPSHCLYGYDPDQFERLGFTYKLAAGRQEQHFCLSSAEYQIDQNPSLWCSLKLLP